MNSRAFPNKTGFTKYVEGGGYGQIFTDDKGRFVLKNTFHDRKYDIKPGDLGSAQYEYNIIKYLSSICPEFTTAPSVLTRVPTDEERERGKLFVSNPLHTQHSSHEYLASSTAILMPFIQNASTVADLIKNDASCSEYDVLVCVQQALLVFLCIGDAIELDDVRDDNLMISKSATYVTEDGLLIERPPKLTFIDSGKHILNHHSDMKSHAESPFFLNIISIFQIISPILQTSRFTNIARKNRSDIWSSECHYKKVLSSKIYEDHCDPPYVQLERSMRFFAVNIFNPLISEIEKNQKIDNIVSADKKVQSATKEWKLNRIHVISHLHTRINYLLDVRTSQLREGKPLKPISTWELDQIMQ